MVKRKCSNLGEAYRNRIRGDKSQNLEKAIKALQNALQVYTPTDFLQCWAMIQNNLGLVYREQWQIEQAVTAHENALKGYNYQEFPEEWADTQTYLGNVYSDK
ncbi:MAG: tetratricopeptide repeat protein, partial [Coleofasciculus sp.]